jgi:DNA-binding transcriptional LysR family regulator
MQITLKQIEIFSIVANELSYTHAAKILNMTQPAVSAQIKNLEEELDIKLFNYTGKKLTLTTAGREISKKTSDLKEKIEIFKHYITDTKELHIGKLNISMPSGLQKRMFSIIRGFHQQYPRIQIDISIADHTTQLKLLQNNKVDFILVGTPLKRYSLSTELLYTYPTVIIAPANHPLTQKTKISVTKLAKETFIISEHHSNSRHLLEEKIITKETKLISINNTDATQYAVSAGLGMAVINKNALDPALIGSSYQILDVVGFPIQSSVYITCRNKKLLSPAAQAFKNFAIAHAKQDPLF